MNPTTPVPHLACWVAAGRIGHVRPADWRRWADQRIIDAATPASWLIEMSLAADQNALERLASTELPDWGCPPLTDQIDDAAFGYLWLQFEQGHFTLPDCLNQAGIYADTWQTRRDCEEFYVLLNQLNRGLDISDAAREIFEPYRATALTQWHEADMTRAQ